jgi:hypothetical protein
VVVEVEVNSVKTNLCRPHNATDDDGRRSAVVYLTSMASKAMMMVTILVAVFVSQTQGWTTGGIASRNFKATAIHIAKAPNDDNSDESLLQSQNSIFEAMSIKGADKIAKMSIPERAKRAMLAEATEDSIFELTERLDGLVEDDGTVSVANREKAMDLARQAKKLQMQYNDLVNGNPSSILQVLDEMGNKN